MYFSRIVFAASPPYRNYYTWCSRFLNASCHRRERLRYRYDTHSSRTIYPNYMRSWIMTPFAFYIKCRTDNVRLVQGRTSPIEKIARTDALYNKWTIGVYKSRKAHKTLVRKQCDPTTRWADHRRRRTCVINVITLSSIRIKHRFMWSKLYIYKSRFHNRFMRTRAWMWIATLFLFSFFTKRVWEKITLYHHCALQAFDLCE